MRVLREIRDAPMNVQSGGYLSKVSALVLLSKSEKVQLMVLSCMLLVIKTGEDA